MNKLKVALLSSVLALGLGQSAHAVYTQEQLVILRQLVAQGDADALLAFIENNPELLDGDDSLAAALKQFVVSRNSLFRWIVPVRFPDLSNVPDLPPGTTSQTLLASGSLSDFGS